jgi:hypothetical protein
MLKSIAEVSAEILSFFETLDLSLSKPQKDPSGDCQQCLQATAAAITSAEKGFPCAG